MASGPTTQISDIIVPEVFTPYTQQLTETKSRLVQSGVVQRNAVMDQLLAGGGLTFGVPSWKDLDDDADNVSSDTAADAHVLAGDGGGGSVPTLADVVPFKTGASQETAVRLSRNAAWSASDLTASLAGADPMGSVAERVSTYWSRRLQAAFVATMQGVIADNTANDSGDYTNDISGASYSAGVTDFSAEAFIDAAATMGDSYGDLSAVMVHSVVYARMQKNNLIDFIPDSEGMFQIPTFLGHEVIVDDAMPKTGSVYDTWIFGYGSIQLGVGAPKVPTETYRYPGAGNGGGEETLYSRVEWAIHPVGHAYAGTAPNGGPSNAATSNNLAAAGSWNRVYAQRKQVKFARLVTREA
jgi:hypothetical protein